MVTVVDKIVTDALEKVVSGQDYRKELTREIDRIFFIRLSDFFDYLVKHEDEIAKDKNWYENVLINNDDWSPEERAAFAGMAKKTIKNMRKTTKKDVMIEEALDNFSFLSEMLPEMVGNIDSYSCNIGTLEIKGTDLFSLIAFIGILKNKVRGGVQSSFGKKIEKVLMDYLCDTTGVPEENREKKFVRDKEKDVDREVDYYLIDINGKKNRCEVKMMGSGNPESVDAIIARETDIFVADTLSQQNRNQLAENNVQFLECKDNDSVIEDFKKLLDELEIPYDGSEE